MVERHLAELQTVKPTNEILIVGMAKDTRDQAPWDLDGQVHVMNEMVVGPEGEGYEWVKRWDVGWQIHRRDDFSRADNHNFEGYWDWLQNNPGDRPIMMQEAYEDVPGAVAFDPEEVRDEFGEDVVFTCTLAYCLGWAALQHRLHDAPKKIHLYGFSMGSDTEFRYQRDSVKEWLGILRGIGVEVVIPEASKLHHSSFRDYGFEGSHIIFPDEFAHRKMLWNDKREDLETQIKGLDEVIEMMPEEDRDEAMKQRVRLVQKMAHCFHAAAENDFWENKDAPIYRQLFELRNREWKPELEKHKSKLNTLLGRIPERQQAIASIPSRQRGRREKEEDELRKMTQKRERHAEAVIGIMARINENEYWMTRSEMQLAVPDDEVRPQARLQLVSG